MDVDAKKPSEGSLHHSRLVCTHLLYLCLCGPASTRRRWRQVSRATHLPESIGSPAVTRDSSDDNVIGPGTSALGPLRWLSYALVIPRYYQPTSTVPGAKTQLPVHIAMARTKRWRIWCSAAQLTTRPGGTLLAGRHVTSLRIHDASGASWTRLRRWPPSDGEWERAN